MLLRSAARVTRSLSGTSCTSGVPWHPLVATSSFHSCCSKNSFWCSPPSSFVCVRWGHLTGNSSSFRQRTFVGDQFLVEHRTKTSWSRKSLVSPSLVSLSNTPLPLLSPQLLLNSSFSSKPSKEDPPKPGIIAKYKQMMKDYWYVLIPVHVATSVVWFGGFYLMLKSGVDIVGALEFVGTSEKLLGFLRNSEAGYYALSYACYKIATPVRYTVTVGGTTIAITKLQHTGYLKSTSELREGLKKNYDEGKENLKEKYEEGMEDLKEKYDDKKEDFIDMYQEQRKKRLKKIEEMMRKRKKSQKSGD